MANTNKTGKTITLYVDDTAYTVPLKTRITGLIADESSTLWITHISDSVPMEEFNTFIKKYKDVKDKLDINNIDTKKLDTELLTEMNEVDIKRIITLRSDIQKEERLFNTRFIKLFIDKLKADPKVIEQWESDEFWQNQDIEEMSRLAIYFRNKLGLNSK